MLYFLLMNRQGKIRLQKWYASYGTREKLKIMREVSNLIINRRSKMCNIVEYKGEYMNRM